MRRIVFFLLGMLLISAQLLAQNRSITGTVKDDKGKGVPNASVLIKGTNSGTTTDDKGSFTLSVPSNARALIVSYVGLGEKEISLNSNQTYSITLSGSSSDLSEVVVVAYGQQK